jgi:hypothetical protein
MSTTLELKIRIRELEARVSEHEKLLKKLSDSLESTAVPYSSEVNFGVDFGVNPAIVGLQDPAPQVARLPDSPGMGPKAGNAAIRSDGTQTAPAVAGHKLCPKCGVKPAYFFHVRSCGKQKEEKTHGDDGNRSTGGS